MAEEVFEYSGDVLFGDGAAEMARGVTSLIVAFCILYVLNTFPDQEQGGLTNQSGLSTLV